MVDGGCLAIVSSIGGADGDFHDTVDVLECTEVLHLRGEDLFLVPMLVGVLECFPFLNQGLIHLFKGFPIFFANNHRRLDSVVNCLIASCNVSLVANCILQSWGYGLLSITKCGELNHDGISEIVGVLMGLEQPKRDKWLCADMFPPICPFSEVWGRWLLWTGIAREMHRDANWVRFH